MRNETRVIAGGKGESSSSSTRPICVLGVDDNNNNNDPSQSGFQLLHHQYQSISNSSSYSSRANLSFQLPTFDPQNLRDDQPSLFWLIGNEKKSEISCYQLYDSSHPVNTNQYLLNSRSSSSCSDIISHFRGEYNEMTTQEKIWYPISNKPLKGHLDEITDLTLLSPTSHSSTSLVSCSKDGLILVWESDYNKSELEIDMKMRKEGNSFSSFSSNDTTHTSHFQLNVDMWSDEEEEEEEEKSQNTNSASSYLSSIQNPSPQTSSDLKSSQQIIEQYISRMNTLKSDKKKKRRRRRENQQEEEEEDMNEREIEKQAKIDKRNDSLVLKRRRKALEKYLTKNKMKIVTMNKGRRSNGGLGTSSSSSTRNQRRIQQMLNEAYDSIHNDTSSNSSDSSSVSRSSKRNQSKEGDETTNDRFIPPIIKNLINKKEKK